jgi:hypothetical protein
MGMQYADDHKRCLQLRPRAVLDDWIYKSADSITQPHSTVIAVLKDNSRLTCEPNAGGSSCQYDRARLEGRCLRKESDGLADTEDLIPGTQLVKKEWNL